jgi:hypothetical protein
MASCSEIPPDSSKFPWGNERAWQLLAFALRSRRLGQQSENVVQIPILAGLALVAGLLVLAPVEAGAAVPLQRLELPKLSENVACVVRRVRTVGPNGVYYRNVRTCGAAYVAPAGGCRMVRERVVGAGGRVYYRSVRRCW